MKKIAKTVKFDKINNNYKDNNKIYHEKKLFKLRKEIKELFFDHHFNKSMIAKKKKVSRNFVIKWTKSPNQDFTKDLRGWQKGKRRKWTKETEKKIQGIYDEFKNDPSQFYLGATAIEQEWRKKYPRIPSPPLRTIGQILRDLNISKKIKKDRHKGAAKYLCYPEYTIFNLIAKRVLELDFVGNKYITGKTEPLNFIGFSFKKEPKLRYFKRILGESGDEIVRYSKLFFEKFEKPDAIKMDNGFAMAGIPPHPRVISKVPLWCLSQKIIPIYSVPRKPFSQASIEGNNSVFSKKFWKTIQFKSIKEVDIKLEWFNLSSEKYLHYHKPKKNKNNKKFISKIYFTRQVLEDQKTKKGYIDVLNEKIFLKKSYINYFVLAEWNLKQEQLYVHFEKEQKPEIIKKISFKINSKSKEKLEKMKII